MKSKNNNTSISLKTNVRNIDYCFYFKAPYERSKVVPGQRFYKHYSVKHKHLPIIRTSEPTDYTSGYNSGVKRLKHVCSRRLVCVGELEFSFKQ